MDHEQTMGASSRVLEQKQQNIFGRISLFWSVELQGHPEQKRVFKCSAMSEQARDQAKWRLVVKCAVDTYGLQAKELMRTRALRTHCHN